MGAADGGLGVGAGLDVALGSGELCLDGLEVGGGLHHARFRALKSSVSVHVLPVAAHAGRLQLTEGRGRAGVGLQGGEGRLLLEVVGLAQHLDEAGKLRRFGDLGGVGSTAARGAQRGQDEGAAPEVQSTAFGGGPICTRSPRNAPTRVKRTPSADIRTYMNAGIVFTVWFV